MADIAALRLRPTTSPSRATWSQDIGVGSRAGLQLLRDAKALGPRRSVRFCFCKKDETLAEAERRLTTLRPR